MYYRYEARRTDGEDHEFKGIFHIFTSSQRRKWYCLAVPNGMRKIRMSRVRHGLPSMATTNGMRRWKRRYSSFWIGLPKALTRYGF